MTWAATQVMQSHVRGNLEQHRKVALQFQHSKIVRLKARYNSTYLHKLDHFDHLLRAPHILIVEIMHDWSDRDQKEQL